MYVICSLTGELESAGDSLLTDKAEMLEELHKTLQDLKRILEKIGATGEKNPSTGHLKIEDFKDYSNSKSSTDKGEGSWIFTHGIKYKPEWSNLLRVIVESFR